MADLRVNLCGVEFANPVIAASGCFGFGAEYAAYYPLNKLGGISLKGLTPERREGNPAPRIAETPSGMLNAVGLQNPGIDVFLSDVLPGLAGAGTRLIANIAGRTVEDYCLMATRLQGAPIDMIEMNISCPNVREGGVAFGARPESIRAVVAAVKPLCTQPLMVKLTPNTADIAEAALASQEAGADAVSLINTLTGMAIDVHRRQPILGNVTGGLSGPAVMPVALRMVWQAAQAVRIPVVGMGGITTGEDAVAFLLAGAAAVQVGTANLIDPTACVDVLAGIERYMKLYGIEHVTELIGALNMDGGTTCS